jgi:hypothetical protein
VPSEIINTTIFNTDNQQLSFLRPDTNLKIRNPNADQTYSPTSMLVSWY